MVTLTVVTKQLYQLVVDPVRPSACAGEPADASYIACDQFRNNVLF